MAERFFCQLKESGAKVFFSNSVLPEKGVANYMLEIQSALEGARAILIVYSRPDYISRGWVAQEWMTFLNLLMKDHDRDIYLFSIRGDVSGLPPFLRPYECFTDYDDAIRHLKNGLGRPTESSREGITRREFLNAYWGLFGNSDMNDYLDKDICQPFANYGVYRAKSRYLNEGDAAAYAEQLERLAEEIPLAAYLLSRHYRDVRYLNLPRSEALRSAAWEQFRRRLEGAPRGGEVALVILRDQQKEYNGAFYMCDVIYDVLDAYEVKTDVWIVDANREDGPDLKGYRKLVFFWPDVCLELREELVEMIRGGGDRVLVGLNSFGGDALPYDLKGCALFENDTADITKLCRTLLG